MRFFRIASAALLSLSLATIASAQASRTWVSGVGDDANPCSRTAPCKTFAGAISKTASGGEIDALDPAGYGAVTITKPITIDGNNWGSVLVAGTNGIVINATGTAQGTVYIRNLSINGIGSGINGINIFAAGSTQGQVVIDNVTIFGFTTHAVNTAGSIPTNVDIRNCHFHTIAGTAVQTSPSVNPTAYKFNIDSSDISNNGVAAGTAGGVYMQQGGKAVIRNSNLSFNTGAGVEAGVGGEAFIDGCNLSHDQVGARTSGGTIWLSRNTIYGSTGGSSVVNVTGGIATYGDNKMGGNGSNTTGTPASPGNQ